MKRLLLVLTVLLISGAVNAAVLKFATVAPEGSQWMKDMRAGAAEIKERTEGRVQIKYYGGGVMGNDKKVLAQIRIRRLHGGAFTPSTLADLYGDINLYGLPLVFRNEDEIAYVRSMMDERLMAGMYEAGFKTFGFSSGGFAYLMSNVPITKLDDMRGKKVWVPEGDSISFAAMEALSLSPVSLPLTDVLTGLQTGLIETVGMSPIGAIVLQWHTKVDYMTDLPMLFTFGFMAVDTKAWEKIDAADQAIIEEVMIRTYRKFDEENPAENANARDALLNSGVEVVEVNAEEAEKVREILGDLNRELAEQDMFSIELYDEMLGHIESFRAEQAAATEEVSE